MNKIVQQWLTLAMSTLSAEVEEWKKKYPELPTEDILRLILELSFIGNNLTEEQKKIIVEFEKDLID